MSNPYVMCGVPVPPPTMKQGLHPYAEALVRELPNWRYFTARELDRMTNVEGTFAFFRGPLA